MTEQNLPTEPAISSNGVLAVVYSDGKDYSHLEPNSEGFDETAEEGEFDGTCVNCGSEQITVISEADICHNCRYVYTYRECEPNNCSYEGV